jgi:hypothetical protein
MELLIQHYNASSGSCTPAGRADPPLRTALEQKIRGGGYNKVKQKTAPLAYVVEIRASVREIKDELRFVSFRFDSDTGLHLHGLVR